MLTRSSFEQLLIVFGILQRPFNVADACRAHAKTLRSKGPVTSHVIEIGINATGECERKRGERTRLIAEAMFPGRETVLDVDASDYKAGKIVVLVAGIRQEAKAC